MVDIEEPKVEVDRYRVGDAGGAAKAITISSQSKVTQ